MMTSQADIPSCSCAPLSDSSRISTSLAAALKTESHNDDEITFASFPQSKRQSRKIKSTTSGWMMTVALVTGLFLEQPLAVDAFSSGRSLLQPSPLSSTLLSVASITPDGDEPASGTVSKAAQKLVVDASNAATGKSKKKDIKTAQQNYAALVDFDWQPIAESVFEEDSRPIILFDGVCNLCNGGVNFAMDHDSQAQFRFASLQSNVAQSLLLREGKHPTQTQNIVLVTPDTAYYASHAVAKICSKLDMPLLQLVGNVGQALPKQLREPLYKFVSEHRFVLGENDSCRLDLDGEYTNRFVSDPTVVSNNSDDP